MCTRNWLASPNGASHCLKKLVGVTQIHLSKKEKEDADWVIVAIHGLREYLDHTYRQLLDILREMPDIVSKLGISVDELPDFTTVCSRKQDLKMDVWRKLLGLSTDLFDTGEIQAIDSTSIAHRSSSRNYAKRVQDTFDTENHPSG